MEQIFVKEEPIDEDMLADFPIKQELDFDFIKSRYIGDVFYWKLFVSIWLCSGDKKEEFADEFSKESGCSEVEKNSAVTQNEQSSQPMWVLLS